MNKNLGILFNDITKKNQNKIAIKFSEEEQYSYLALDHLSENFINFFNKIEIKKDDKIVLESIKNINSYAIMVACIKMGVPYTFVDFAEAPERYKLILKQLKPKKIFTFSKKLTFKNCVLLDINKIKNIKNTKLKKKYNIKNISHTAYIMFTSGSTGKPKGVKITHSNLFFLINWSRKYFNIKSNTTFTNLNPLHFDNSVFDFYCSIFNEASLIAVNKSEIFDFKKLKKKLIKLNCNIWFSVPSLLNLILKINTPLIFRDLKINKYIFGGEPFPVNSIRNIFKHIKNSKIYNVSGPTECTCICSAHLVKKKELFSSRNISIGKINNYFNYKIKNINSKKNLEGELFLEGPAVSEGYINNKKDSVDKFYSKSKSINGYKTGDVVKEDNKKLLYILGRTDNQIKILGHRIEIEEIENTINHVFKLSQCLIVLKEIKDFPYKKLILLSDSNKINADKFRKKLSKNLPRYMLPEDIKLINKFKFNVNGKIDRKFYEKKFR